MKKVFLFLAAGVMLFTACKPKETVLECNVDPDEVFGQHYTAADFQMWSVLNSDGAMYDTLKAQMQLPDTVKYGVSDPMGLFVALKDTAVVIAEARRVCDMVAGVDGHRYFPALMAWQDGTAWLMLLYGTATPEGELSLIDGTAIASAKAVRSVYAGAEAAFVFNSENVDRWASIMEENMDRCIAMTLGGRVLSAPRVTGVITDGRCSVSGNYTDEEVCALAAILNNK